MAEEWEPPDREDLRKLAQGVVDDRGGAAYDMDDAVVKDALDLAGLLSPATAVDERADRDSVAFVQSRIRWLLA